MAKVNAPLLSWGASGTIADVQTYSSWKGRPYVRQRVIPANPDTAEQQLTRNTFRFLNKLWAYMPAGAIGAWNLYGDNNRFTARNGWLKVNNGVLRTQTDLTLLSPSPAAGGGIPAASMSVTPGSTQLTVALTAPSLPTGWTIVEANAVAILSVNPQTSDEYEVVSGTDASDPYSIVLAGLTPSVDYLVGGWFEYTKPDGLSAYGVALTDVAQPTA